MPEEELLAIAVEVQRELIALGRDPTQFSVRVENPAGQTRVALYVGEGPRFEVYMGSNESAQDAARRLDALARISVGINSPRGALATGYFEVTTQRLEGTEVTTQRLEGDSPLEEASRVFAGELVVGLKERGFHGVGVDSYLGLLPNNPGFHGAVTFRADWEGFGWAYTLMETDILGVTNYSRTLRITVDFFACQFLQDLLNSVTGSEVDLEGVTLVTPKLLELLGVHTSSEGSGVGKSALDRILNEEPTL